MIFIRKKINFKDIVRLISSGTLLLLGLLLFIIPLLKYFKPCTILYIVFVIYSGIKLIEYIITKEKYDNEDLYVSIASILVAISGFKFGNYPNTSMVLAITLFSWVGIMAIIKIIKMDFYHDRKNGMFYVSLICFSLFLLIGFITCINLYYNEAVDIVILGFFFIFNGLLSLMENSIRIFASKRSNIK